MRILLSIAVICMIVSCKKEAHEPKAELPVSKKIEFHVHADQDYSDSYYTGATAEVKMAIYRINYRTGAAEKLWDTTFSNRAVQEYPVLPEKFVIEKQIPVFESREKLQANYNIIYRHNGHISQQAAADECVPGEMFTFLDVGI